LRTLSRELGGLRAGDAGGKGDGQAGSGVSRQKCAGAGGPHNSVVLALRGRSLGGVIAEQPPGEIRIDEVRRRHGELGTDVSPVQSVAEPRGATPITCRTRSQPQEQADDVQRIIGATPKAATGLIEVTGDRAGKTHIVEEVSGDSAVLPGPLEMLAGRDADPGSIEALGDKARPAMTEGEMPENVRECRGQIINR